MAYERVEQTKGVCGVGFKNRDTPVTKDGKIDPAYRCWANMLARCYSGRYKSYDAKVCKEWHEYEVFKEWFYQQDWEGKELDKDIRGDGCLYSPETCIFVSKQLNNFLVGYKKSEGGPYGSRVMRDGSWLYKVFVRDPFTKKRCYYGSFRAILTYSPNSFFNKALKSHTLKLC